MGRCLTIVLTAAVFLFAAAGCSQSTRADDYEVGNQQDFEEGRRDRLDHRDFD